MTTDSSVTSGGDDLDVGGVPAVVVVIVAARGEGENSNGTEGKQFLHGRKSTHFVTIACDLFDSFAR